MHDKPFTVGVYLLVGILVAFAPLLAQLLSRPLVRPVAAPIAEQEFGGVWRLVGGRWGVGCLIGLLLGLTLPWWRKLSDGYSLKEALGYAAIVAVCLFALSRETRKGASSAPSVKMRRLMLATVIVIAALACFTTGILGAPQARFTAWHHWGAYIAPAEMMLAGERIFVDFPAQYGLGPTTLIASACGAHCWAGMYYIAGGAAFGFVLCGLLLVSALGLRTKAGLGVLLAVIFATGVLWVSYAPGVASPITTPSVTGLRFLPALILAAALWWSERSQSMGRHWMKIGFALFTVGVLWSPESLFMSLAVWGPYYCLRRLAEATAERRFRTLFTALMQLAFALVLVVGTFLVVYRLSLGVFPGPRTYLAYMLFPPGPMPINPKGPVWYCCGAIALGAWAAWRLHRREGNSSGFRSLMLFLLLGYASVSYALGRSHDNNFLNLLPYSALLLASVLTLRLGPLSGGAASGMLASLLGLLALFGWDMWARAATTGRLLDTKPQHFIETLSYDHPATRAAAASYFGNKGPLDLPEEARALAAIRKISNDPVAVVDMALLNQPDEPVWSSLHGPANFTFMPADYKARFLASGAARLRRSGWLLIHKDMSEPWVSDFQKAYAITEERDFGAFRAIHFAPRLPAAKP